MRFACITLFLVSFFMIDVAAAQGCAKQGRGSCNGPFCNVICCATNAYIGTCSTNTVGPGSCPPYCVRETSPERKG